jgi:hypothetical protein
MNSNHPVKVTKRTHGLLKRKAESLAIPMQVLLGAAVELFLAKPEREVLEEVERYERAELEATLKQRRKAVGVSKAETNVRGGVQAKIKDLCRE